MITCGNDINITGSVHIQHFRNDELIDERIGPNLIVDSGKAAVASRINGDGSETSFNYIGIGIGTTSPVAGNTALETERDQTGAINTTHKLAVSSRVTTTITNDTAQLVAIFYFTTNLSITESGVFNATPNGTMLARQTFTAFNIANGDILQITWKIKSA